MDWKLEAMEDIASACISAARTWRSSRLTSSLGSSPGVVAADLVFGAGVSGAVGASFEAVRWRTRETISHRPVVGKVFKRVLGWTY